MKCSNFNLSGQRFDYRDPQLMDLTRKVNEAMLDAGPKFRLVFIAPWLRRFRTFNTFQDNKARFQVSYYLCNLM